MTEAALRLRFLLPLLALLAVATASALRGPGQGHGRPSNMRWFNSFAGPWIAYVDKITNCDEKEMNKAIGGHAEINVRVSHWNPLRPLELQTLNGYLRLVNSTIDDDHWMKITLAVRSNNQWKKNAFVFNSPHGACSFGRANLPGMMEAAVGMDTTSRKPCLIPEGTYWMRNRSVDWNAPNFPVLPYGHYRVDMQGSRHGVKRQEPGLCAWCEVHIVPKHAYTHQRRAT